MKIAQIFQDIEETQFLNKLSSQERIFFIGETEPLKYIENFLKNLKQLDDNHYCHLSAGNNDYMLTNTSNFQQYWAIIIVSFKNEAALFKEVRQKADELKINIPILRLFADVFINHACKRKLLRSTSDQFQKPKISYAILTTPRSGSTYFCELLDSTGIAGHPYEHLRLAAQELTRHCNFDYLRFLYNLMRYRTTSNGVFGTKFISHFLFEFQRAKPDFKQIFSSIDKYILLVRKDKAAQAVSLVLAQKTEIWHLHRNLSQNNPNYQAYQSKLDDIEVNDALLSEVEKKFKFIQNQEARLKKILSVNQIEPLVLVYEDIVEAPKLQVNRILNFLGIDQPEQYQMNIRSGIKKMPSNISQKIIHQFKQ